MTTLSDVETFPHKSFSSFTSSLLNHVIGFPFILLVIFLYLSIDYLFYNQQSFTWNTRESKALIFNVLSYIRFYSNF